MALPSMGGKREKWQIGLVLAVLACLYAFLLRPAVVGLWGDDTIYLTGAKAIATGQGYRMLSEPGMPAIIKYPPLFPTLLAPIWLIMPTVPQNLPVFKLFVIGLGLAAILLFYRLARRFYGCSRAEAAGLCLLAGTNYIWLRCVVEVLSEPLFMLLFFGLVYAARRLQDKQAKTRPNETPGLRQMGVLILLSCAAFYTRTIGAAFIAGMALWLGKRFGKSAAFTYLGSCLLICLPWAWWTLAQPETIAKIDGFYVYPENQTYLNEFFFAVIKSHGLPPILQEAASQFPGATLFSAFSFLIDLPYLPQNPAWIPFSALTLMAGLMFYALYRLLKTPNPSVVVSCLWFYAPLTFMWYSHGQYPRLMLCVAPFLYLALCKEIKYTAQKLSPVPRIQTMLPLGVMAALIAGNLLVPGILQIPRASAMASNLRQNLWRDYQGAFSAIVRLTEPGDILWSRYNGLYYLYTGRKTINRNIIPGSETGLDWLSANRYQAFYRVLHAALLRNRIRYILLEPNFNTDVAVEVPEMTTDILIHAMPGSFEPVYSSPDRMIRLYRLRP